MRDTNDQSSLKYHISVFYHKYLSKTVTCAAVVISKHFNKGALGATMPKFLGVSRRYNGLI